jgi:arylsulfatase A-like enzyme
MNILWIITDDQPAYMMEPMPFTRKFIRDIGINFEEGHADIPLCGPARVSTLTGLSVNTHRINVNNTWDMFVNSPLDLNNWTIATILQSFGYSTGHFGKYINGHARDTTVPPGWSQWTEVMGDGGDETHINMNGHVMAVEQGINVSMLAARDCADFVADPENILTGWFAQYCPTIPHRPYTPEPEYEHMYDGDRRDVPSTNEDNTGGKPRWMRDLDPVTGHQSEFEGKKEELRGLDQKAIKHIYETLLSTGQLNDTLIFFTSDNGYHHGEHRLIRKDRPYWESAQVPFFVRGPGVTPGVVSPLFVNHLDLFPTTLAAAGISPLDIAHDGRNLLPLLLGAQADPWRQRMLITGSAAYGPEDNPGGAREPSGHWWLLREGMKAFILRGTGHRELYWMESDPYQMRSKAATADQDMMDRLEDYTLAMKEASGDELRRLEEE